jgi:hypothetical protein
VQIIYLDPRPRERLHRDIRFPFCDLTVEPANVGLIENSFADAGRFMDHVEAEFNTQFPFLTVLRFSKPQTSPAAEDLRREIRRTCRAAVSGYGH